MIMKKITGVLCLILLAAAVTQAQEFKKFRVGLGGGYAMPSGTGSKAGGLIYVEPGYRLMDQLLVGARFEFAGMIRGYSEDVSTSNLDISFSGSESLFAQYYFSNNNFRPFVGAGLGIFGIVNGTVSSSSGGGDTFAAVDDTKFGFFPRIGFDTRHFTLSLDFNIIGASKVKSLTTTNEIETKNSYIGIRFGGFFGGGRK
jgi:hypothetical protein